MRLKGGRTGKRAVVCEGLELTGLMKPFDLEVWYGERVAVLGSNGSGKSHFLRLLAAGGSDPDVEHRPVGEVPVKPVDHTGQARLGARVRPGWFVQTHEHPELVGRTLLEILHRGDDHRDGMPREPAARALDRYELAHASEQKFESLSGGQQARFQILLLELSGATLLLLDEPTDNLDVRVGRGAGGRAGGVRGHGGGGDPRPLVRPRLRPVPGVRRRRSVYESDGPVWDEGRVAAGPLSGSRVQEPVVRGPRGGCAAPGIRGGEVCVDGAVDLATAGASTRRAARRRRRRRVTCRCGETVSWTQVASG